MRKTLIAMLAALLVFAVAPTALAHDDAESGGTYLSLGDSIAAGTQQPAPFTENGYADLLYEHLEKHEDFDTFVNLACPGDDTIEMRFGTGGASTYGSACYGPFAQLPPGGDSQLDVAVAYLLAHPGEVELITIAVGANDVLACNPTDPPDVVNACLGSQLGQIAANLPFIIGRLQAVAPGVPIVAMNYYNPNLAYWITGPAGQDLANLSLTLTTVFNDTLQSVYDAFGVPVVDVASVFKTYKTKVKTPKKTKVKPPKNVKEICKLTLMCEKSGKTYVLSDYDPGTPGPQTDIHPSNAGYKKIAKAFKKLIHKLDILD